MFLLFVVQAKILAVEGLFDKADTVLRDAADKFGYDVELLVSASLVKSNLRKHNEVCCIYLLLANN